MEVIEYKNLVPQESDNQLWFQRAQWVLKAIISGGVGLKIAYLNGLAYNEAYSNVLKMKAFLFALGDRDLYVGAYSAAVFGLSGWVEYATSSFLPLLIVCGVTSLVWFAPTFMRKISSGIRFDPQAWRNNKWGAGVVTWLAANAFAIGISFYVPVVLLIGLILAPSLGNYAGTRAAEAKLKNYERGCKAAAEKHDYCYVLLDKGEEVARGFPIARGDKSIALWWKGEVRIEETSGRSLRSHTQED